MWMMLKPLSGHLKSLLRCGLRFSTLYFTYISSSNSLRLCTQTSPLLHQSGSPHNFLFLFVAQYSSSPLAGCHSPQWAPTCSLSQMSPPVLFSIPTAISFWFNHYLLPALWQSPTGSPISSLSSLLIIMHIAVDCFQNTSSSIVLLLRCLL